MTGKDFADAHQYVIVWYAGVGCPGGNHIALLHDTQLPFDLEDLHGNDVAGVFEVTNLAVGRSADGWQFRDWRGNTIYRLQLYTDTMRWLDEFQEYNQLVAAGGSLPAEDDAAEFDIRYYCPECHDCWEEQYSTACDSECGLCGIDITALMFKPADANWTDEQEREWQSCLSFMEEEHSR